MFFTSGFPNGNGKMTECIEYSWGYEIYFFAETKAREPQPLWFHFKLSDLKGEKVVFHLTNAACTLGGLKAWNNNRPVYRYSNEWHRSFPAHISIDELMQSEAVFEIPVEGENVEVAFCFPYNQNDLDLCLTDNLDMKRTVIGYSAMGRPIYRYSTSMGDENKSKQGIYIIARQHSGEVTGSLVLDGIIRYLSSLEGKELSDKYVIWFVPFADTDGVELGWYGKDQIWGDMNRSWGPDLMKRPETRAINIDLRNLSQIADIKMVLDLHSPASGETENYFSYDGEEGTEETAQLKTITKNLNAKLQSIGKDPVRIVFHNKNITSSQTGFSLDMMCRNKGWNATAFEASYQGDTNGEYSIQDYRTLGKLLIKSILEI